MIHVSRNPDDRCLPAKSSSAGLNSPSPDNRSYTAKGGKSSAVHPVIDEYEAEANTYGSGMSKLVNASGSENQDVDAAGMLSSTGLYTLL